MAEGNRVATDEEMAEDAIATATEATEFTKIAVDLDGRRYELEFNRTTVKRMEREGFSIDGIRTMPVTMVEKLVIGAFEMHHPSMTTAQRLAVWAALGGHDDDESTGEQGLVTALMQLYMAPVNALIADPTTPTGTWRLV